ncbi:MULTISPECIES: asparagine synthase (glutamine-hydrolyzing) [Streptomyces]|uniref:asparagine synthase (glutamine-hydrolyzing) n=1 Tax=Streptomyces demainii TaxID=588122 RepID=A0ABT9KV65_9ACTN|nr:MULTISPECIES: asparagine synthase (glutamine-hydrolyzing) [Streptomyces]MBW8091371.1 asparagine synthase (glutamine-hydrolyzing) [Streptomyces hygroscopicus subsp. hygroscopicus]MCO8307362.1 asparagine synthase (glutamine-hydrolyzing) [Streptomyces sp. RKCA744]MDN3059057.1 asparagine synthase (glutamine-hydrolyzing) [Streptomyces sp. SRF1]MDP9612332.1 asparagine synthase (glutamine-hydrolyzing) [Streptomyces demainii]
MCGITGWVSFHRDARTQAPVIEAMTGTLTPRGPDAGGVWLGERAAIGHRRLAVIDPAGGAQPMTDRPDDPDIVLSYSGEVYNHHELRAELRGRGHAFRTRSDTEVVLRGYAEWGEGVAEHLHGMFAFAIWDERAQRLVLVRDRLGVKPLFWALVDGGLAFASEPKALFAHPEIRPRVDADGLREAYSLLFNTGPTVWSGVREVEPGGLLVLDRDRVRERRYWQLEAAPHTDGREATVERVRELVGTAARSRLEADVPLCSLLSGGLDSTVLTALLAGELREREGPDARIRSYAVDYSDQAERFTGDVLRTGHDTPYATEAGAFIGTDHSVVVLDPRALLDPGHRKAVVVARDSPIGVGDMDTSLYLLFGEIRRHSTVAVSGEAADEVFGGYPWFHDPRALAADTFPWLLVTGDEAAMPLNPELDLRIGEFRDDTYRDALAAVPHLDGETPAEHRQREVQHLSLTRWLRQLLHRTDRLSMAQGLEVRVPYCDHRLVEYAFATPWALKSFDGREKSLLRAAGSGLAPHSVLHRPKNHYPATHHPDYNRGLQNLAREALATAQVRALADETRLKPCLDTPPGQLEWGHRLRLERVVDLALWLDHHQPELVL